MVFKEYILRPAGNGDVPAIKNIIFSVLKEYNLKPDEDGKDRDLNDVEQNYFKNNGYFGVAIDVSSDQIVGTFGLSPLSKEVCELRKMYLLKPARGKGLGKFILANAIRIAKEKQYSKIILETISPLKEAISLYKKFGFKEIMPAVINDRVDQAYELKLE